MEELWARVRGAAGESRRLSVLLQDLKPAKWEGDGLLVAVPRELFGAAQSLRQEIAALVAGQLGRPVTVLLQAPEAEKVEEAGAGGAGDIASHPLIKLAGELLGARVVGVHARARKK